MTVTAEKFLESAKSCAQSSFEIDARNSISRAYYSVFHESLNLANELFPDPNAHLGMGEHVRLKERYMGWVNFPKHKSVGYILQTMKLERHRADYCISNLTITQKMAVTQVETAERLVQLLSSSKAQFQAMP